MEEGSFLQHLTIPCVRVDAVSRQSTTVVALSHQLFSFSTVELLSSVQVVVAVPVYFPDNESDNYEGKYMRTIMKLLLLPQPTYYCPFSRGKRILLPVWYGLFLALHSSPIHATTFDSLLPKGLHLTPSTLSTRHTVF